MERLWAYGNMWFVGNCCIFTIPYNAEIPTIKLWLGFCCLFGISVIVLIYTSASGITET